MVGTMILYKGNFIFAKLDTEDDIPRVFIPIGTGNCYEEIKYSQYIDARKLYLESGE